MALSGDDAVESTNGLWDSVVTQTADCTAGGANGLWGGTVALWATDGTGNGVNVWWGDATILIGEGWVDVTCGDCSGTAFLTGGGAVQGISDLWDCVLALPYKEVNGIGVVVIVSSGIGTGEGVECLWGSGPILTGSGIVGCCSGTSNPLGNGTSCLGNGVKDLTWVDIVDATNGPWDREGTAPVVGSVDEI